MKTIGILIVGVGGQGTLLASRILGHLLTQAGYDVKVSEVHGMSQRGGSVVTYVKYGEEVFSPIIGRGEADVILAFEPLEACRALPYLRKGGKIIVNTQKINPMPVITGAAKYPEGLIDRLRAHAAVTEVDALALAERAGSIKAVNVALLGVLSRHMGLPEEAWQEALRAVVPQRFLAVNQAAFELGAEQA